MFKRPANEMSQSLPITRPPDKFWKRRRFALVRAAGGKEKKGISQPRRVQVIGESLTCIKIAVVGRKYGHSVKNYASLTRPILIELEPTSKVHRRVPEELLRQVLQENKNQALNKQKQRAARRLGPFTTRSVRHRQSPRSARVPSSSVHFEKHLELVGHFEADLSGGGGRPGVGGRHPVGRRLRQSGRRRRLAELWTRIVVSRGWR